MTPEEIASSCFDIIWFCIKVMVVITIINKLDEIIMLLGQMK